jgi:ferrochelatase
MRTGVLLFNLGGPKDLQSVRSFLFNLFADPAIINLPAFIRLPLALLVSTLRHAKAREIYAAIGGGSPLLSRTEDQARALEKILGPDFKCAIAMRHAAPRVTQAVQALRDWGADRIVFLPMYPQYSASTTGSSFNEARKTLQKGPKLPICAICCYPEMEGFAKSLAALIKPAYEKLAAQKGGKPRLLLSAHGLPQKMIEAGDPYAWQCEKSAGAVARALGIEGLDWKLCYQSRVGPLEWVKPYTEEEIRRAGEEKKPLLIAPLAFTADNSETLYEIDQLYRDLALQSGCPGFASTPCVGTHASFIWGLSGLVREAASSGKPMLSPAEICPAEYGKCACK